MKKPEPSDELARLNMPARLENVPHAIEAVLAAARSLALDSQRLADLELALEESLVNIVDHAYIDAAGPIVLSCRRQAESLAVRIEDEGIAFDPTSAPAPDLDVYLEDRPIGGLGIRLVHHLMDAVHHQREGNRNILTLIVNLSGGGEAP